MRRGVGLGLVLLAVLLLVGCQARMPGRAPTLTPVLLPRETPAPPATVPARAVPKVTPAAAPAGPATAPDTVPATGNTPPEATPAGNASTRLMAIGLGRTIILRVAPSAQAAVVAEVPGVSVFWAEGRSEDGKWLRLVTAASGAGQESGGWAPAGDVKLYGEPGELAVTSGQVAPAAQSSAASQTPETGKTQAPAASAVAPAQTQETPRPRTVNNGFAGQVVFQAATGDDIYLLGRDGGLRVLTQGLDPALSPDGGRVAFARWGTAPGIYVLDLATGQERQVAGAERPRSPSWSSDGARLVFSRFLSFTACRQSPFGCLTEDELRARFGGQDCVDAPTGRLCIVDFPVVQVEQTGLTAIGANGEGWQDLPAPLDAQTPSWRPGTNEILFLGGGKLQITGPDRQPAPSAAEAWTISPAWSPDGTRIVAQRRLHDNWALVLLDATGATVKVLTSPGADDVAPAWTAEGGSILFLSNRDGAWRTYRINADGTGLAAFRPDALQRVSFRYDYASERVISTAP